MPLALIPQQPYFTDPNTPAPWNCLNEREYCHLVAPGDPVKIQFEQSPCNTQIVPDPNFNDITEGAQLLLEPDFTTVVNWVFNGAEWTHAAGKVTHIVGNTGTVVQVTALGAGWHHLEIVILDMTAGTISVSIDTTAAEGVSPNITDNGTYNFYLNYTAGASIIITPSSDFDGSIDRCKLWAASFDNWTLNVPWVPIYAGGICKSDVTTTAVATETGANYILLGKLYEVVVTISGYAGTGFLTILASDIASGQLLGNGQSTFWATPTVDGKIVITASAEFSGCVDLIEVFELRNDYEFTLINSVGETTIPSTYVSYFERWVMLSYDFFNEGQAYDCYYIGVTDLCEQQFGQFLINPEFIGGGVPNIWNCPDWGNNNATTQYDYTGNKLKFSFDETLFANSKNPFTLNIQQPAYIDFEIEVTNYRIAFEIDSKTALAGDGVGSKLVGDLLDIGIGLKITGQDTVMTVFIPVGVHTYDIALPAGYGNTINIINALRAHLAASFNQLGGLPSRGNITVKNVTITKLQPFIDTFTTECLKYGDHPNTILIQGTCFQDGNLGFNWSSGFVLSQRVRGRSMGSSYLLGDEVYTFSSGDTDKYYADRAKFWEIFLDIAPPSVHDTISTQIQCNNLSIGSSGLDLIGYVADSDYVPQYDRSGASSLAQSRLKLKKKNVNTIYNRNC